MYSLQELNPVLLDLQREGIIICPFFAKENGESRLDPSIFEFLDWESRDFANLHWNQTLMVETFGDLTIPRRFPRTSLYETAASTAVYLCENKYGAKDVTEDIAKEALQMVTSFIQKHGYGRFIAVTGMVTAYENYLALNFYGAMEESDYLLGTKHRPWIDYSIEDELILSGQMGTTRVTVRDGKRWVELTEYGQQHFEELKTVLGETGYLGQRAKLLRISQFSHLDDYEITMNKLFRNLMQFRRDLLVFGGIQPGMNVLELGCGPGTFTIDAGLVDLVGPKGHITALDPAHGMLARAKRKLEIYGYEHVDFIQGKAEELPFEDNTFDAVTGYAFLHFTDIPTALKEMCRVVKPGGMVSTLYPLSFPVQIPFISEWFLPLIQLGTANKSSKKDFLPTPELVPNIFKEMGQSIEVVDAIGKNDYTNPETVVKFFVECADVFEDAMAQLPWRARKDMVKTLIERGKEICRKYPESDLIIDYPAHQIRCIVQKTAQASRVI